MRKCLLLVGWLLASASPAATTATRLTAYVNPFVGSDGTGHTFPGASVPFGMVAPSPDNADRGWDYTSGYRYRAPRILGFSNTHISGAGIPELGDVLLQPVTGTPWTAASSDFASRYDKRSERARPGYYTATLTDHRVRVELTASTRVALQRYTFARPGRVQVLADLQHGLVFEQGQDTTVQGRVTRSDVKVDEAAGELSGTVHSRNWVEREASFVLHFDHPIAQAQALPPRPGEHAPRVLLSFDLGRHRVLQAQVALSTVDPVGARRNLAEVQGRSFDQVRAAADAVWEAHLSRIRIEAAPPQKRIFYTALYHALLHPSEIADVDGRVRGPTGEVYAAPGGRYYSTLSLWDTFRAVHPLLTLVAPERVDGIVQTMLLHQRAQGYLPLWTAWGRETWTMIGNPALPVIADAVAKGFQGFDLQQALQAMVATATAPRPDAPEWAQHDWADLDRFGYLPIDRVSNEAVSRTLEYGIGDDATARVARAAGRADLAERFAARAQGYRHLWDSQTRMMRGKDSEGRWRMPFDPLTPTSPMNNPGDYTEANAWQYTLTPALHDPKGLVAQMGGPTAFERWLDAFFSTRGAGDNKHLGQEALIGQYAHGNEPSHHIAYLYAWTEHPEKGHAMVRRIAQQHYRDTPDGIAGNDDCGQMSAWYVLSTLGFYPVVPASGSYVLGRPLVRAATLNLAAGTPLRVRSASPGGHAPGTGQVLLNGRPVEPTSLLHTDLLGGGELRFPAARARH
jgi:predicted alpha-1,2-mannosidase